MKFLTTVAAFALLAGGAGANEFEPQIRAYLESNIMEWAADPILTEAIIAQNAGTSGLSEDDILTLDQTWRAEVGSADTPTISPVLENPAAVFLRQRVEESQGAIMEVFVMDMRGLNVAASAVTSDYWQGDEAKFENSYLAGAGAVFIDEVEFDESSQAYLAQVSITVVDPATQEPVGAMTIGLNAEQLF